MAGEIAWISHYDDDVMQKETEDFDLELGEEINEEVSVVSVDIILPDDLLERILSYLPIVSIFRASCVCKRWHTVFERFLSNPSHCYLRNLGILCSPALMNHLVMLMILTFGNGIALNSPSLELLIGSFLHHMA